VSGKRVSIPNRPWGLVARFEYEDLSVSCPFQVGVMGRPSCEEAGHIQILFVRCCEAGKPVFGSVAYSSYDGGVRQYVLRPARCFTETEVLANDNDVVPVLHIRKRHCSR
jgi:hypothetical protein